MDENGFLSKDAKVRTNLIVTESDVETRPVRQYGLEVRMTYCDELVAWRRIPDISTQRSVVCGIAERVEREQMLPCMVPDFVECELSK